MIAIVQRTGLKSATRSLGRDTLTVTTRPNSSGVATRTTIHPDGTKTVETLTHGLTTRVEKRDTANTFISATNYGYDAHQRLETVTDSRTGNDGKTTYFDFTESGTPLKVTTPGGTTTTTYDLLGRATETYLPGHTTANPRIKYTSYYPTGRIQAQWGFQTYPTYNIYNEPGQLTVLRTYRNLATSPVAANGGPVTTGDPAITTWNYSATTGLLTSKLDNASKGPSYLYTPAGRIWKRTSARNIVTDYTYAYGYLTRTDYNDSTPDVVITYDSLGRQQSVSNGLANSTFDYDDATDLGIDTETITYTLPGQSPFQRILDRRARSYGRDTGWQLKNGGNVENEALYTWSATSGRLETVANAADTFSYDYEDDSYGLLATVTKEASGGNPVLVATRAYEATRDVLTSIQNNAGTTVRSSYDYAVVNGGVNSIGQRKGVRTTFNLGGSLDANPGDTSWGYDNLGQVTSASAPGTNADRAYQFDTIGNRLFSEISNTQISDPPTANTTGYTANALNQYAAVNTFVPTHDADGNQIDSQIRPLGSSSLESCVYTWDAENRLKEVRAADETTVIASYLYDAQSRRIAKIVGGITTLYVYDGFNCIAEYFITGTTTPLLGITRTWGMDLSGNLQGAGGVGGLLAEKKVVSTYYPTYDGNGNISEYLTANGAVAAHFEYDPFGNIVKDSYSTGFTATSFTYKFSTKPLDAETGLYYYQYRYLDPLTGRWQSRDPIEEEGGVNLYEFVLGDPLNYFDDLGHQTRTARNAQRSARNSSNQRNRRNNQNRDAERGYNRESDIQVTGNGEDWEDIANDLVNPQSGRGVMHSRMRVLANQQCTKKMNDLNIKPMCGCCIVSLHGARRSQGGANGFMHWQITYVMPYNKPCNKVTELDVAYNQPFPGRSWTDHDSDKYKINF